MIIRMPQRSWTDEDLIKVVKQNKSYRSVLKQLGLVPAGGNYVQIKRKIEILNLDTDHLKGKIWNTGLSYRTKTRTELAVLLTLNSRFQSYKLKKRLYEEGLKRPECELCGWAKKSIDGRIPLELDHINGDHYDNRIENLRILCPNCHSLQPTHRGRNKKVRYIKES